MKNTIKLLGNVVCFGAVSLLSAQAKAECTGTVTNHAVFVFDQSNSMNETGAKTIKDEFGQPKLVTAPKWQIARDYATAQFATLPTGTIVSVVGFGNTTIGGADYYHSAASFEEGLKKGTNDSQITAAFTTATTIGSSYWTPFAGGVCDALTDVWTQGLFDECDQRRIFILTDGLENSTPTDHQCYSATSSSTPFNIDLAGSGFGLQAGSWERKIASLAYAADVSRDQLDSSIYADTDRPVINVQAIFDYVPTASAAVRTSTGVDSGPAVGYTLLSDFGNYGLELLKGVTNVTRGSYFEATVVNGAATKMPLAGDTDPAPTRSCVDAADLKRIKEALNIVVATGHPVLSVQDLAMRDVNDDLIVDSKDYILAVKNNGKCSI